MAAKIREVTMSAYTCELCDTDHASYAGMMRCEADCYEDAKNARRNHVSPKVMRPMRDWKDD